MNLTFPSPFVRMFGLVFLLGCIELPTASACIWDTDTIEMENSRFPEVIDIITGNFPRHSKEFYEWRAEETRKKIDGGSKNLPVFDDHAVSLHKLGNHQAACEVMKIKEGIQPGVYETYSNVGTFLIYSGDLPKSLNFIDKALSINPNAHFGREKFQKWLVEWAIKGMPDIAERLGPDDQNSFKPSGYAAFVLSRQPIMHGQKFTEALRTEAIRGVLGMMRFADFDNPILQEALGDLLVPGAADDNAVRLASMAYQQALQNNKDPVGRERLQGKLSRSKLTMVRGSLVAGNDEITLDLRKRIAVGNKLAAKVRTDEMRWIADGKDVSVEFRKKYMKP